MKDAGATVAVGGQPRDTVLGMIDAVAYLRAIALSAGLHEVGVKLTAVSDALCRADERLNDGIRGEDGLSEGELVGPEGDGEPQPALASRVAAQVQD